MISTSARALSCAIAVLTLGSARPLHAQLEIGTWVRQATDSMPAMTMRIETCCNGGRRLTYHVPLSGSTQTVLTVETRLDGRDAEVLMDGRPSGETMAISRLDAHHATTLLRMNGNLFGTANATLSADGRTLTVTNDYSSSAGGQPVGKYTEVWVRQ